jgi:hypothetical protein
MDRSECPIVEVNPRRLGAVPIVKGTRVQADAIVENYESVLRSRKFPRISNPGKHNPRIAGLRQEP